MGRAERRRQFPPAGRLSRETAQALTDLMNVRGVSANRLAHAIGISQTYLSQLMAGTKRPSIPVAEAICDVLSSPAEFRACLIAEAAPGGRYSRQPLNPKPLDPPLSPPNPSEVAAFNESTFRALQYLADSHMLADLADELERRESYVYVARIRDGLVKIGTSLNPWRRVRSFYGDPICFLPGGYGYERVLHESFAEYHRPDVGREVFEPSGRLAEFILEHAGNGLLSSKSWN